MYVVAKQVTINSIFFFSPFFSNIRWTSWAFSVSHWTLPRPGLRLSGDRAGWKGGLGRNVTSSYSWGSNMWWRVCCVLSLGRGGLGKRNRMRKKKQCLRCPFSLLLPTTTIWSSTHFYFNPRGNQEVVESMVILKRLDTNLIVSKLKSQWNLVLSAKLIMWNGLRELIWRWRFKLSVGHLDSLWWRTKARNVTFRFSLRCPITI